MNKYNSKVVTPTNLNNPPEDNEIQIAQIIANHYNAKVEFLRPIDDYKRKTPDVVINGQLWEIKSPTGKARGSIERQLKRALKQSRNVIIDARRSLLSDSVIELELKRQCTIRRSIRKLVLITKAEIVIEILWK